MGIAPDAANGPEAVVYSHHYLDDLVEDDLPGCSRAWRVDEEKAPDQRLNRLRDRVLRREKPRHAAPGPASATRHRTACTWRCWRRWVTRTRPRCGIC